MDFIYNPSRSYVEINEPILYELFRSTTAMFPAGKEISSGQCEAYICTSRENKKLSLYIAFWETASKAIIVYEPAVQPESTHEYRKTVDSAKQFVTNLGFELSQVNIDYSTAMRQVIFQTIKVLKPPPKNSKPHARTGQKAVAKPEENPESAHEVTISPSTLGLDEDMASAAPSPPQRLSQEATCHDTPSADTGELTEKLAEQVSLLDSMRRDLSEAREEIASLTRQHEAVLKAGEDEKGSLEGELASLKEQHASLKAAHEEELAAQHRLRAVETDEQQSIISALQRELEEEKIYRLRSEQSNGEKIDLGGMLAEKETRLSTVTHQLEKMRGEMDALKEQFTGELYQLQEQLEEKENTLGAMTHDMEKMRAEADSVREKLEHDLEKLRGEASEKEADLISTTQQLGQMRETLKSSKKEHTATLRSRDDEREAMRTEIATFTTRVVELETALSKEREEAMRLCLELEEKAEAERELRQEMKNEVARITKDKDDIERITTAALTENREERQRLISELESLRGENASLRGELEAEILSARAKADEMQDESSRLKREILVREEMSARELAGLRAELRRLIEERAAVNQECVMIEAFTVESSDTYPAYDSFKSPAIKECRAGKDHEDPRMQTIIDDNEISDIFVGFMPETDATTPEIDMNDSEGPLTKFNPNNSLKGIPCASTESIVALYESANKIQTVPDGFKIQKSGSYICAINHNGASEIYLAWQMLESNQVLVYTPSHQPRDDKAFRRVLNDALFYFESVGFMMSPVDLSVPQTRARALKQIPVIRKWAGH